MSNRIFFHAHHAPIGAYASFTLGYPGASGGFDLELAQPPKEQVYVMMEQEDGGYYQALPFYGDSFDEGQWFTLAEPSPGHPEEDLLVRPFRQDEIKRDYRLGTDTWQAGALTFRLLSQVRPVPDPETAREEELQEALVPAILAELTLDNRNGSRPRKAMLGYQGSDPYSHMRRFRTEAGVTGVGQGRHTAIATLDPDVQAVQHRTIERMIQRMASGLPADNGLGKTAALLMEVPAGECRTYRFALCFYRGGEVTSGETMSYWYTRYFPDIERVAEYALEQYEPISRICREADGMLAGPKLSENQRFMMIHSIRSYYGNTQLLDWKGRPFWVVNEGQYKMMNTFDLTVDQLFYEMRLNPWTVRNELDFFAERFSYTDEVRFPGEERLYPGGLSFTHDMGVANALSRPGYSSYEQSGLTGCFSYMTHEQLTNWVLCAAVYAHQTGDREWLQHRLPILEMCLSSMLNRDHPDPEQRNGIMGLDSSRCLGGAEITTYDSLDVSLGQARNNIYLAGKCWAAYVALERILRSFGRTEAAETAAASARRCADTLAGQVKDGGYIPAVLYEDNDSRIIPAIEGLVFPYACGCDGALGREGPYASYIRALERHLHTVLSVEGGCLFEDGGWKLSSTSSNSWLSKIYLCQFVARRILGLPWEEAGRRADSAHVAWLTDPRNAIWCWSDQILSGLAKGSKYYPRGVTSILWLEE
ncbi:glycoside hydrolase family 52 protein [Gorillibacterium sp. sgz5001074]|uniref:glycoside hydrolase family 52 protein n=1 Tax=Gorillibacterium sp. sgz5001074 TaxID=3446695 RepID=UPI003F673139